MTITPPDVLAANQVSYRKMRKDPVRYARHLKRCRRAQDRYLAKIRADPLRYQAYLAKMRKYSASQRASRCEIDAGTEGTGGIQVK